MKTTSIGRIVHYTLSPGDVDRINDQRARSEGKLVGNTPKAGQVVPMVIVQPWSPDCVNGRVLLDGNDDLWVTSAQRFVGQEAQPSLVEKPEPVIDSEGAAVEAPAETPPPEEAPTLDPRAGTWSWPTITT